MTDLSFLTKEEKRDLVNEIKRQMKQDAIIESWVDSIIAQTCIRMSFDGSQYDKALAEKIGEANKGNSKIYTEKQANEYFMVK